jgi:hypothetical protein
MSKYGSVYQKTTMNNCNNGARNNSKHRIVSYFGIVTVEESTKINIFLVGELEFASNRKYFLTRF